MVVLCHSMSLRDLHISIHVPAWGTTIVNFLLTIILNHFNPRSRVGNDFIQIVYVRKEVTFQSTFPRGERRSANHAEERKKLFQSTFPRGERPTTCSKTRDTRHFNPRSRVGNDPVASYSVLMELHFNPRSRVGNDIQIILDAPFSIISIHVPAWGTTQV